MHPRQSETVHAEWLNNELCLYDWSTKHVHSLNATAARVWQLCDGNTSPSEMAVTIGREFGTEQSQELVWSALEELRRENLITGDFVIAAPRPGLSRRDLIVRLGATAALIPVVSSIVAPSALHAASTTVVFNATGGGQTFLVPAGVTFMTADVQGAQGGKAFNDATGFAGKGGRVQAAMFVTPGETLTINVGALGNNSVAAVATAGVFNGGGGSAGDGGSGGGASDIRRGATKLVVAGGGGGSGMAASSTSVGAGGAGGGLTGAAGANSFGGVATGGGGGTSAAGGAAGTGGVAAATAGSAGTGGSGGADPAPVWGGAGGGGGWFGGGGGGSFSSSGGAGGGGGSSATDASVFNVIHTQGFRSGAGIITIVY